MFKMKDRISFVNLNNTWVYRFIKLSVYLNNLYDNYNLILRLPVDAAFLTTTIVESCRMAEEQEGEEKKSFQLLRVEVPEIWWHVIHFLLLFSRIKMYSLLSILLIFSSVFLLITADDASNTLNVLMPDVVAHHVCIS